MRNQASASITLCLVRHGETDWNLAGRQQGRADIALNETGRNQARMVGSYLSEQTWNAIVSSPLARASESARIIADIIGAESIGFLDDLVERDHGGASGMTNAESNARWPDGNVPGLESRDAVTERASRALQSLGLEYSSQRLIVVTHGAFINAILAMISNGEIGSGKTTLDSACLSFVHCREGRWEIDAYNIVAHLTST